MVHPLATLARLNARRKMTGLLAAALAMSIPLVERAFADTFEVSLESFDAIGPGILRAPIGRRADVPLPDARLWLLRAFARVERDAGLAHARTNFSDGKSLTEHRDPSRHDHSGSTERFREGLPRPPRDFAITRFPNTHGAARRRASVDESRVLARGPVHDHWPGQIASSVFLNVPDASEARVYFEGLSGRKILSRDDRNASPPTARPAPEVRAASREDLAPHSKGRDRERLSPVLNSIDRRSTGDLRIQDSGFPAPGPLKTPAGTRGDDAGVPARSAGSLNGLRSPRQPLSGVESSRGSGPPTHSRSLATGSRHDGPKL